MVLQPNKRLTAIQVLNSLDTIIATFRVPAIIGEEDQVVPEINVSQEEVDDKKEGKKESESKNSLSEFSRHITLQVDTRLKLRLKLQG